MNNVVLILHLLDGIKVSVVMHEPQAKQVLNSWLAGSLKARFGEEHVPGPWGVEAAAVKAVQILPAEQFQQAQQQAGPQQTMQQVGPGIQVPGQRLPPGTSGLAF